ncbi:MAG TPA: PAS domain-containing protein, partial [Gillisia sp.]|nr:PAS domain-containing protein [Gillisia sp.]
MEKNEPTLPGMEPKGINDKNSYFKRVADLSPNLLFIIDLRNGGIIYVNRKAQRVLGYDAQDIYEKGQKIFESVLHPDDLERYLTNIENCKQLNDEEDCDLEVRFRTGDNEWQWNKITQRIFEREENGNASHLLGTVENIHRQKIFKE